MARKSWDNSFVRQYTTEINELLKDPRNRRDIDVARSVIDDNHLSSKCETSLSKYVKYLREASYTLKDKAAELLEEIDRLKSPRISDFSMPDFQEDSLKIEIRSPEIKPVEPVTNINTYGCRIGKVYPKTESKEVKRWLLLPDIHVPFQNKILMHKILGILSVTDFHGLVITGDFLDLFSLGSYNADSVELLRDITLDDEYMEGRKLLAEIEKAIAGRAMQKVFLYGNHEDRYFRELARGDRGKYGASLLSPREALNLDKLKYQVFTKWTQDRFIIGNHLEVMHGLYTNIHTAKNHLDKVQGSVIFGHTHRVQCYGAGKRIAYSIGWLGDNESEGFSYMPRVQRDLWMNGFAVVNETADGYFFVQMIQCFKNGFVFDGKLY